MEPPMKGRRTVACAWGQRVVDAAGVSASQFLAAASVT
jgi:hypothetical protein